MDLAEDGTRVFAAAAVGDADRFEEFARRVGAELEKDQLRRHARHVAAHGEVGIAGIDLLHAGAEVDGHLSRGLPAEDFLDQDVVGASDLRPSYDQSDAVFIGQGDGDFERGVAGTDDEEVLIAMLRRIDEPVADVRKVFARNAELARVPLRPHAEDDVSGIVFVAFRGRDLEPRSLLLH